VQVISSPLSSTLCTTWVRSNLPLRLCCNLPLSVATRPFPLQLASVSVVLVLSLSWQRLIASRIFFKHSNENARPFLSFKCITLHFEFKNCTGYRNEFIYSAYW
jgi:hypothetical protein